MIRNADIDRLNLAYVGRPVVLEALSPEVSITLSRVPWQSKAKVVRNGSVHTIVPDLPGVLHVEARTKTTGPVHYQFAIWHSAALEDPRIARRFLGDPRQPHERENILRAIAHGGIDISGCTPAAPIPNGLRLCDFGADHGQ